MAKSHLAAAQFNDWLYTRANVNPRTKQARITRNLFLAGRLIVVKTFPIDGFPNLRRAECFVQEEKEK